MTEEKNEKSNSDEERKKRIEEICRKIMKVAIPCICIMMILLLVFKGSGESRTVKRTLKSEGCDAKIFTDSDDISEVLEEFDFNLKGVEEMVIAADPEDEDVYAIVFFFENRSTAEDAEHELWWHIETTKEKVERSGKIVCLGYFELVEAVLEAIE